MSVFYLVSKRIWPERILSGERGTANYNADEDEIAPIWMFIDLVTQHSETADVIIRYKDTSS